jgi:hypothetical protein
VLRHCVPQAAALTTKGPEVYETSNCDVVSWEKPEDPHIAPGGVGDTALQRVGEVEVLGVLVVWVGEEVELQEKHCDS